MKFLIVLACLFALTFAQIRNEDLTPKSKQVTKSILKPVPVITLPAVDVKKSIQAEKAEEKQNLAPRYGIPHHVNYGISNSGSFQTFKDGSRMWRLKLVTKNAYFTVIAFDKYKLAKGASLFITNKKGYVMGAYTHANNKKDNTMAIGPIEGDEFTLELNEPASTVGSSKLRLFTVTHSYKDLFHYTKNGRSGSCNKNTICPIGRGWEQQRNSVGILLQSSGFRFCTGSLVNNLKNDGAQYMLSAAHCGTNPRTWVMAFNYKSPTCERRGGGTIRDTVSGMDIVAFHRTTDFMLARIRERIPPAFNVFLAGWNANDSIPPTPSVGIHHPSGDTMKISHTRRALTHSNWSNGPANTHWRVQPWDDSTTEGGSSGSPLYDNNKRVIGQLHGGTASCSNMSGWDVYGKIARSWTIGSTSTTRLRDHLDPENTGKLVSDGVWLNDVRK